MRSLVNLIAAGLYLAVSGVGVALYALYFVTVLVTWLVGVAVFTVWLGPGFLRLLRSS